MAQDELIIGLHIAPTEVRAVAIAHQGQLCTLRAIDLWPAAFPGSIHDETPPESAARGLTTSLRSFLQLHGVRGKHVALTYDSGLIFFANIPVPHLSEQAVLNERIGWELQQYFPGAAPGDFIHDVHVMANPAAQDFDEIMVVAVRRRLALAVERAIVQAGLQVQLVDTDPFSADVAVRVNYADSYSRFLALCGVKSGRIDISLLRNGILESFRYQATPDRGDVVRAIDALARTTPGLTSVMMYGPNLDNDLVTECRKGAPILVEALNPFRKLTVATSVRPPEHLTAPSYRFAAAIGVALRRD